MATKQMSFIVRGYHYKDEETDTYEWWDNTEDLDAYLEDGWRVVSANPMGAFGYTGAGATPNHGFGSLVIVEKQEV